jgi:hypothetical protein
LLNKLGFAAVGPVLGSCVENRSRSARRRPRQYTGCDVALSRTRAAVGGPIIRWSASGWGSDEALAAARSVVYEPLPHRAPRELGADGIRCGLYNRLVTWEAAVFHSAITYDHFTADGSAPPGWCSCPSSTSDLARQAVDRGPALFANAASSWQRVLPFGSLDCTIQPEVI